VANLKEVRTRIASVKSTQQITSAMKLVAASKLRRAQTAIQMLRPYAGKLREILQNLSGTMDNMDEAVYAEEREVKKILLVVVTSNRGLCGPFNTSVLREAKITVNETYRSFKDGGNLDIFCIGKKGGDHLRKQKFPVVEVNNEIFEDLTFENSTAIAESLMEQFASGKYDRIEVIYNQFKNAAVQILTREQFLPVSPPEREQGESAGQASDFIFEPSKEEIVSELLPKTLRTQLFKILIDSFAAEQGARMTAMHQATENAKEMIKDLQLAYNKARQATITRELIEIVSGADALRG
jgi:F-type H+-transporting ATPase subunit gamma